jgi:hypothetical protein
MALWKLIAFYLGTPTHPFESPHVAKVWMQSIFFDSMKCSDTGRLLAQNVILSISSHPPSFASPEFLTAEARCLNGDELCDDLGLMQVGILMKMLVLSQFCFVSLLAYTQRMFPTLDRRRIARAKRIMFSFIVTGKTGLQRPATFDLQYVPQLNTKTELIKDHATRGPMLLSNGVERRNAIILMGFLIFFALVGLGFWLGLRVAMGILKRCARLVPHLLSH